MGIPGRRYKDAETLAVISGRVHPVSIALGRTKGGVESKRRRLNGKRDDHVRDGSHKYIAQEKSKKFAVRNGLPWGEWEDKYLIAAYGNEDALEQAIHLQRTYRAVEDRRKRLWRRIDATE